MEKNNSALALLATLLNSANSNPVLALQLLDSYVAQGRIHTMYDVESAQKLLQQCPVPTDSAAYSVIKAAYDIEAKYANVAAQLAARRCSPAAALDDEVSKSALSLLATLLNSAASEPRLTLQLLDAHIAQRRIHTAYDVAVAEKELQQCPVALDAGSSSLASALAALEAALKNFLGR